MYENNIKLLTYEYPNWREIQSNLDRGRICPICGKVFVMHFNKHLYWHGFDQLWWMLKYYNLDTVPKCKYCNGKVPIDYRHYIIHEFCSPSCKANYRVSNGTFHLLHDNLKFDSNGNYEIANKAMNTKTINRTNAWFHENLVLDERGCSINHSKANYTRVELGNHNFAYNGDPEHDRLIYERDRKWFSYNGNKDHDDKLYEMKSNNYYKMINTLIGINFGGIRTSFPEELLFYLLKKLCYTISRSYDCKITIPNSRYNYFPDFYIKELDLYVECEGKYKYENNKLTKYYRDRHNLITQITKKHIVHIHSNSVFYYNHHLDELNKLLKDEINKPLSYL